MSQAFGITPVHDLSFFSFMHDATAGLEDYQRDNAKALNHLHRAKVIFETSNRFSHLPHPYRELSLKIASIMFMTLGFIHVEKKEFRKSIEYFEEGQKVDETNHDFVRFIGHSYYFLGEKMKAIGYYFVALQYSPSSFEIMFSLGLCCMDLSFVDVGRKYLEDALAIIDPFDAEVDSIKGSIFIKLERYDDAIFYYQHMQETNRLISPGDVLNFGAVYSQQGKYDEAIVLFDKIIDMSMESEIEPEVKKKAFINKAKTLLKKNDYDSVAEICEKIEETYPEDETVITICDQLRKGVDDENTSSSFLDPLEISMKAPLSRKRSDSLPIPRYLSKEFKAIADDCSHLVDFSETSSASSHQEQMDDRSSTAPSLSSVRYHETETCTDPEHPLGEKDAKNLSTPDRSFIGERVTSDGAVEECIVVAAEDGVPCDPKQFADCGLPVVVVDEANKPGDFLPDSVCKNEKAYSSEELRPWWEWISCRLDDAIQRLVERFANVYLVSADFRRPVVHIWAYGVEYTHRDAQGNQIPTTFSSLDPDAAGIEADVVVHDETPPAHFGRHPLVPVHPGPFPQWDSGWGVEMDGGVLYQHDDFPIFSGCALLLEDVHGDLHSLTCGCVLDDQGGVSPGCVPSYLTTACHDYDVDAGCKVYLPCVDTNFDPFHFCASKGKEVGVLVQKSFRVDAADPEEFSIDMALVRILDNVGAVSDPLYPPAAPLHHTGICLSREDLLLIVSRDIENQIPVTLVSKRGSTSGLTTSVLEGTGKFVRSDVKSSDFERNGVVYYLQNIVLVSNRAPQGLFARAGDSGSLVVTADGDWVGFIVAGKEATHFPVSVCLASESIAWCKQYIDHPPE